MMNRISLFRSQKTPTFCGSFSFDFLSEILECGYMKKYFLFLIFTYFTMSTFSLAASSPVVQVISYKEPLGMYFSLQGWGSGSVIDNAGHILTNNHVVDDGF